MARTPAVPEPGEPPRPFHAAGSQEAWRGGRGPAGGRASLLSGPRDLDLGRRPAAAVGHQVGDGAADDVAAVAVHLVAAGGQQLGGWDTVAGEVAVQVGGRGVARRTGVHHEDPAAGPGEDQRCGQARSAAADDHHVVLTVVLTHAPRLEPRGLCTYERCCLWETGVR